MGAARWVVIGTALVAAATAFHMLMSPADRPRPVSFPKAEGPGGDAPNGAVANGAATNAPPEDEIDPESREAMRDFLRQAAQGEE